MPRPQVAADTAEFLILTSLSPIGGPAADLFADRRRKAHTKSRSGCATCKKRHVKCDLARPVCGNCARRREPCAVADLRSTSRRCNPIYSVGSLNSPPRGGVLGSLSKCDAMLWHYFITETVSTLAFGRKVWHHEALQLAIADEPLMHAVLLVSARHLEHMSPGKDQYRWAAQSHLSKLLPMYRSGLSGPLSASNADALIAISALLLYFLWSEVGDSSAKRPEFMAEDKLFSFAGGVRESFLSAASLLANGKSIFSDVIAFCPKEALQNMARRSPLPPSHFEAQFLQIYKSPDFDGFTSIAHSTPNTINQLSYVKERLASEGHIALWHEIVDPLDAGLVGLSEAIFRLAPLASVASNAKELRGKIAVIGSSQSERNKCLTQALTGDEAFEVDVLARCIYAWPQVSSPGVLRLVQDGDERIAYLLLQFYQIIKSVLPDAYWWAHRRADSMISMIQEIYHEKLQKFYLQSSGDSMPPEIVKGVMDFARSLNDRWREYTMLYKANGAGAWAQAAP